MMIEVLRSIETAEPSVFYAWASWAVAVIASVALIRALAYLVKHWTYTHWLDVLGVCGALISSLTYATYYTLLLLGFITTAVSPILLRPVNVGLFAGLVLLARLVVINNKILRELEEINSALLFIFENWRPDERPDKPVDGIQLSPNPVSGD